MGLFDPNSTTWAGAVDGVPASEPLRVVVDGTLVTRNFADVAQNGGALEGPTRPLIFTTVKDEACQAIAQG